MPTEIDEEVAKLKLQAMGVEIDALTAEQRDYLSRGSREPDHRRGPRPVSDPISVRARFERFPATVKGAFILRGEDANPHQVVVGGARSRRWGPAARARCRWRP